MKATVMAKCPRCGNEISMEGEQRHVGQMELQVLEAIEQHKHAVTLVDGRPVVRPTACADVEIAIEVRA